MTSLSQRSRAKPKNGTSRRESWLCPAVRADCRKGTKCFGFPGSPGRNGAYRAGRTHPTPSACSNARALRRLGCPRTAGRPAHAPWAARRLRRELRARRMSERMRAAGRDPTGTRGAGQDEAAAGSPLAGLPGCCGGAGRGARGWRRGVVTSRWRRPWLAQGPRLQSVNYAGLAPAAE